jgi:hypothetical protein
MSNSHGLRTTGTHTGNFGKAKVKGNPGQLDLTKEILNRETCNIPDRDEAFTLMQIAYNKTDNPKMKQVLGEMLRSREATLRRTEVKPMTKPPSPYWDNIKRIR